MPCGPCRSPSTPRPRCPRAGALQPWARLAACARRVDRALSDDPPLAICADDRCLLQPALDHGNRQYARAHLPTGPRLPAGVPSFACTPCRSMHAPPVPDATLAWKRPCQLLRTPSPSPKRARRRFTALAGPRRHEDDEASWATLPTQEHACPTWTNSVPPRPIWFVAGSVAPHMAFAVQYWFRHFGQLALSIAGVV